MDNIVVYNNGELELKVSVDNETVWLTQKQIAEVFDVNVPAISKHIKNIYQDNELNQFSTVSILEIVQKEGNREVSRSVEHYNLDIILAIGYRTNSSKAIKFRQWATTVLKNYIQNGYAINEHKINELRLSTLENDIAIIKSHIKNNSIELKQGIFYDGQVFDAYVFVSELIKSAKNRIVIIDNYIDETVLTLFSKNASVEITIYTQTISKQLTLDIEKYNKQYNKLNVKTTKKFHDRFMLVDDAVYHIGASLKDLGNKVFAFSKIDIASFEILKKL
jgi:prophage antirepressor-like protein